jgi:hypothetical protein
MPIRTSPVRPWHRLGITKKQYLSARIWKRANMSRDKYEKLVMSLPQDVLDEVRLNAETDLILEGIFGNEAVDDL